MKQKTHMKNTMKLCRVLKLLVIPSAHPFEDDIMFQMINGIGGLVDKTEYCIGQARQDEMRISKTCTGVTGFRQSQTLPVQSCEMLSDPDVES